MIVGWINIYISQSKLNSPSINRAVSSSFFLRWARQAIITRHKGEREGEKCKKETKFLLISLFHNIFRQSGNGVHVPTRKWGMLGKSDYKTNLSCNTPYRRSTAVSLETYSFYIKINSWKINGILFLLTNRLNKRSQLDKNVNRFAKSIDKKGKTTSARDTNITIKWYKKTTSERETNITIKFISNFVFNFW